MVKIYAEQQKLSFHQTKGHFTKLIQSNGLCHGQCLAIVELLQNDPKMTLGEIFDHLRHHPRSIYFFQILEIMRGFFIASKQSEILSKFLHLYLENHFDVFIDSTEASIEDLFHRDNYLMIIAYWTSASIAHTVLYCCDDKNEQYWFYDSNRNFGLFRYPNFDLLKNNIKEYLQAVKADSRSTSMQFLVEIKQTCLIPK